MGWTILLKVPHYFRINYQGLLIEWLGVRIPVGMYLAQSGACPQILQLKSPKETKICQMIPEVNMSKGPSVCSVTDVSLV